MVIRGKDAVEFAQLTGSLFVLLCSRGLSPRRRKSHLGIQEGYGECRREGLHLGL